MSYTPPTPPTPRTPPSVDEWGAQRSPAWSEQPTIPSPRQWAYQQSQSQEDLPSPIQIVSEEGTPNITYDLVYHNDAETQQRREAEQQQRDAANQQQELLYGMAFHVHNVFENIKDTYEEIMQVLGGRIQLDILQTIGPDELITALDLFFASVISRKFGTPFQQGEEYNKVRKVLHRLYLARREFLNARQRNEIFTWIQFVMRQPDTFQFEYIELFINDTYFAYDGASGDNISCVKGISERLLLSIADACIMYCIQYKKKNKKKTRQTEKNKKATKRAKARTARNDRMTARNERLSQTTQMEITGGQKSAFVRCDNAIYRKLIRLFKKEVPDMNDLTKDWNVIFTGELAETMTTAQIKQSFIDFMDRKYKLYGLNKLVAIHKRADEFDEIFERREF
jgi:hypothetical protein